MKLYNIIKIIIILKNLDFVQEHIKRVDEDLLTTFHSEEYIDLIKIITPENKC